ncbi:MAG: hypothetical protein ABIZ81_07850 [Opitutaceae bacterium]
MKNPSRRLCRSPIGSALLALLVTARVVAAITPTEWQHRQPINVAAPGLIKVTLPAATFDVAQPQLADLRLTDASGQELAYLLDRDQRADGPEPARTLAPKSFRSTVSGDTTQLLFETGTQEFLDAIELETSVPFFLKAAHVEISPDGGTWQSLGAAHPLFRQFGAAQLRLPLGRVKAAFVRVTVDEFRSRQIAFTGGKLFPAPVRPAPPVVAPLGAQITRREEFAGETVLTITLDGRHVLLASLGIDATDALFMRRVTVSVREARDAVSVEKVIGTGTIYRITLEGAPTRTQLDVPLFFTPRTRELLVHIDNGDSPPLSLESVRAQQHPVTLLFLAPAAGTYTLLSGNPQIAAPRYDLAAFAGEMRQAAATSASCGELEAMPNYRARDSLATAPLPDVPLTGAPLDTNEWKFSKAISLARSGVQELELDPEVLAGARADFADLRLLRDGNQIPYVLEQPLLARSLPLEPKLAPDAKRPNVSVWQLQLPQANLPLRRIVLTSTTPLFQRQFRIYEKLADQNGTNYESTLVSGSWNRTPEPGVLETKPFELPVRLHASTLWIETDNGDNPPVVISGAHAVYPVVRLVFKTAETEGFTLAYGNAASAAPRYDLSLVAAKLVASSREGARFAAGPASAPSRKTFNGMSGGVLFWGALALVVVVLLVVVAKLLPKPNPPAA